MQRLLSLSVLLAIVTALSLRHGAAEAEVDPHTLDAAETNVCVAKTRLDGALVSAQDGLVESFRDELAGAQAEHRRLTGSTFNTARCNGAEIRTSHAQAAERQRNAQANAELARVIEQHEAGERPYQEQMQLDAACTDQEVLSLSADVAARLFPPGYVNEARARHAEFTRSYQQRTGKPFDPATLCP